MKRWLRRAVCLVMFFTACSASADDAAIQKCRYQTVFVSNVELVADMDRNSPEEVKYYSDLQAEATVMITKFFKGEGFAIAESPDPANERLLIINTKAVFNAGNRALRWVGGIGGAGKASADVTMEAIEPRSGHLFSKKNAQDTLRMGGFGGSAPGLLMGVIDTAWNYLITDIYAIK